MIVSRIRPSRLALAALLVPALATPAHARPTPPPPAAAAAFVRHAEPSANELTRALRSAIDDTNEDPDVHAPALRQALDDVARQPGVVGRNPKLQSLRIEGLLYLARALLALDDRSGAVDAIDEAIRVSGGNVASVGKFGPSLEKLYDERRGAPELRPAGAVQVSCTGGPCRVFLDGRVIGTGTDISSTGIPLGPHVIRIEPQAAGAATPAGDEAFEQQVLTLSDASPSAALTFAVPAAPPTADGGEGERRVAAGDSGRKLPRWAGILGMTLGAVAVAGGVFAIAIDGRCPDLSNPDPSLGNACRDVHDSIVTGAVVLGAGVGAVTGFGIAFGLGERKDKRHANDAAPTSAAVTYTVRF
ncbi:MAG: hypothetical protein ACE37F_26020 [Nannocystaceae bacterium]|nr:hypothetical protein [bacterium]